MGRRSDFSNPRRTLKPFPTEPEARLSGLLGLLSCLISGLLVARDGLEDTHVTRDNNHTKVSIVAWEDFVELALEVKWIGVGFVRRVSWIARKPDPCVASRGHATGTEVQESLPDVGALFASASIGVEAIALSSLACLCALE